MATIKSFTGLEQSKKLAEILPLESADVVWVYSAFEDDYFPHFLGFRKIVVGGKDIKAWSLAALLGVFPMIVGRDLGMYCCWQNHKNLHSRHYDNPVDACYELILKLNELKML